MRAACGLATTPRLDLAETSGQRKMSMFRTPACRTSWRRATAARPWDGRSVPCGASPPSAMPGQIAIAPHEPIAHAAACQKGPKP